MPPNTRRAQPAPHRDLAIPPHANSGRTDMPTERRDEEITLGLLAAVEARSDISQRQLSSELGVALGLANSYLKRCIRKGLVKVQQVPRRRYAYYLTPTGFAEKARLTGEYLTSSLQFYRRARAQLGELMAHCEANGWRRIVLVGATELAEISTLTAHDHEIELVGVIDGGSASSKFCGLPVFPSLEDCVACDAAIVTQTEGLDAFWRELTTRLGEARVLAPPVVRMARACKPETMIPHQSQSPGEG